MTMERETKNSHQIQNKVAAKHGATLIRHASPARRGQEMTAGEYRKSYMGRGQAAEPQAAKLLKQGYRITESGRAVKVTRK